MAKDTTDFRGLPLVDESYSYKSQFVEQRPITDLVPYLESAFSKGVKAIKWNQFVPGFNDGEPCEFTIHDVYFTGDDRVATAWTNDESADYIVVEDDEDGYQDDYAYILSSYRSHPDGLTEEVDVPIGSAEFEYAVRAEFGDDVTVVITPESTYKFSYDCGY